ncbi:nitroreductase family protein [Streptosporangium sp. NPDC020145]|uniref:nitroreductase family protein n=1 Tax=Streptosporangium sp. NPDC020145 TaxID=3154694 RepID=UPI003446FC97
MSLVLSPEAQDLLFREARTANTFTTEPVSDEQVRAIYDLVKYAPTAMNQQPLRVVLVRSPQARERLVRLMAPGNQAKTAAAPLVAILAADEALRSRTATFNAALQVGYFILGVRAAGLAAGPMAGYDAAGVDKEFLDEAHTVLAVVNIGRPGPDAWFDRLPRLTYEEVVTTV